MKHYMDIQRLKPECAEWFAKGDNIHISEKIDGANFSIKYNLETDEIESFSRKNKLDFSNNLRGAWQFSQTLNKEAIRSILGDKYILFGEWLVSHTIVYPAEAYNKAYFYDVWDCEKEKYLTQDKVKEIVDSLELIYAPVFYEGEFISWDHVQSFVGRTDLGGENGEGVVIKKNDGSEIYYVKIVGEKFKERKSVKKVDPSKVTEREMMVEKVKCVVTDARVKKILNKFVDEGIIPDNWDERHMKDIAKNMGRTIYYDCIKEEPDVVNEVGELFGKISASEAMKLTRKILEERLRVN